MAESYRYTFTVTPLTDREAQQVIDDIRARFGRKPLIHVIGRQPSNTSVHNAPKQAIKGIDDEAVHGG